VAIEIVNRQRLCLIDKGRVARLALATLDAVERAGAGLTIAFVRDRVVRGLNRAHRGKDRATDVLSFPAGPWPTGAAAGEMADYLGDVVISTDAALRQAEEAGLEFDREVSELVIHGTLHLCGYDHESDGGEMDRLELKLRRKLLDGADRRRKGGR
jgi:probable rRNA maturation factor